MQRPSFIAKQASHPSGLLGRFLGWIMSYETAQAGAKTLELLGIQPADHVLEIGFGHGRVLARALELAPLGRVAGVDVSEDMVRMASAYNQRAVQAGKVELQQTDGVQLPYPDASFDRVYSVHTLYFWSDAALLLREIRRVLRPAGRFVLTFRYGESFTADLPAPIYAHRAPAEVGTLLRVAGFSDVTLHEEPPLYFLLADLEPVRKAEAVGGRMQKQA